VNDIETGDVLNTTKYLLEKSASFLFLDPLMLHDIVKELAP
jgi:hypothetical protein